MRPGWRAAGRTPSMGHMLTRGLLLISILAGVSACARFDPKIFAPLDQTGHAIVTALTDQPSLPRFRPLRQSFSSALADVQPKAQSARERAVLGNYEVVDARLSEMLTVWDGLESRDEAMLPVSSPLAGALKQRYDLPVNTNEPASIYANEVLVALRDDIKARLDDAGAALRQQR